ncbi:MAG TPA: hypothetical protein VJ180_01080, partial [Pyrinomonadaceae bacterium]|nr:hypothetical protein [Pyrinomonadaceae bacterium]
ARSAKYHLLVDSESNRQTCTIHQRKDLNDVVQRIGPYEPSTLERECDSEFFYGNSLLLKNAAAAWK